MIEGFLDTTAGSKCICLTYNATLQQDMLKNFDKVMTDFMKCFIVENFHIHNKEFDECSMILVKLEEEYDDITEREIQRIVSSMLNALYINNKSSFLKYGAPVIKLVDGAINIDGPRTYTPNYIHVRADINKKYLKADE